jgi:hypothetical protein
VLIRVGPQQQVAHRAEVSVAANCDALLYAVIADCMQQQRGRQGTASALCVATAEYLLLEVAAC